MRIGNGYDVHRLVAGRPLILGGVVVPYHVGLEGYSDGDSLTHSIIDALLGAAALGDIGFHFPPGDPRFKDAKSISLLNHVSTLLQEYGYWVANIDSVIVCEEPKLANSIVQMRQNLADALEIDVGLVSVKATTNEGLGHLGRGEAIASYAVALIERL